MGILWEFSAKFPTSKRNANAFCEKKFVVFRKNWSFSVDGMDSVVLQICGSVVSVFSVEQKKVGCQQTFFCLRPFSVQVYFRPSVAKKSGLTSSNFFFVSVRLSFRPSVAKLWNGKFRPCSVVSGGLSEKTDGLRPSVSPSRTFKYNPKIEFW